MFKLVDEGHIDAVIDITTTEIADFLMGGIMSALPDRIKAVARTQIPYIGTSSSSSFLVFLFFRLLGKPRCFFLPLSPSHFLASGEIRDSYLLSPTLVVQFCDYVNSVIFSQVGLGSVGALDMVNFGTLESVPDRYKGRQLYQHNKNITLMRTTPEENTNMGKLIAEQLNECEGEVRFLIPTKGTSHPNRFFSPHPLLSPAGSLHSQSPSSDFDTRNFST